MPLRFSETDPPEFIEYQGSRYRLKKAAMPAKQAEQKLAQIERSLDRTAQQGYPAHPLSKMKDEGWKIDPKDVLSSVGATGEVPKVIMWNPLTDDLLMSDDNEEFHVDLHERYKGDVSSYPGYSYDDWVRAYMSESDPNHWVAYAWGPLLEHMPYFSNSQRKQAYRLQTEGAKAFKRMVSTRAGSKYNLNQLW